VTVTMLVHVEGDSTGRLRRQGESEGRRMSISLDGLRFRACSSTEQGIKRCPRSSFSLEELGSSDKRSVVRSLHGEEREGEGRGKVSSEKSEGAAGRRGAQDLQERSLIPAFLRPQT